MTFSERYLAATKAQWNREALREGQLEWTLWWKTTSINLHSVTSLKWRIGDKSGLTAIETPEKTHFFRFGDFSRRDRLDLMRLLRRIVPHELQSGWPQFCRRFAWPLLRSFEPPRERQPGDLHLTRRRWDVIGGLGVAVATGVASFVWQVTGNPGTFLAVPLIAGLWILLRSSCPKEGNWVPADADPPGQKSLLIAAHLGLFTGAPLVGLTNRWLGPNAHPVLAVALPLAVWGIAMLPTVLLWRHYAPAQKEWKDRKTAEALSEWQRRETPPRPVQENRPRKLVGQAESFPVWTSAIEGWPLR